MGLQGHVQKKAEVRTSGIPECEKTCRLLQFVK